jgi:CBS domain containing-hemolysin-like protein
VSTLSILEIVGILLIVAWNAFFVSAEYAFVAVRRTRIDELVEEGSGAAKRVRHLIDDPARFISAFQVAITLSSLALGAVGEPAVSAAFERVLGNLGALGDGAVAVISVILAFALITALHVVLGEIVPKTLTLSRAAVHLGAARAQRGADPPARAGVALRDAPRPLGGGAEDADLRLTRGGRT